MYIQNETSNKLILRYKINDIVNEIKSYTHIDIKHIHITERIGCVLFLGD